VHAQVQPDWLFISTWNELISQPQVPVVPPYKSMGMESDNTSSYYTFVGERSRAQVRWQLEDAVPCQFCPSSRCVVLHLPTSQLDRTRRHPCTTSTWSMAWHASSDVYGEAYSRDIEPSVDAGTRLYDIMASCIKLFRAGMRACTDALVEEACCAGANCRSKPARCAVDC
jgi:hypothetical protein